ncbi:acyltransferase family protein [Macrococcus brunensis]|uniref:acyltransferase family protein n=1 Tax=Macrococcus brunensis TaxID=198483 RepID=UPI001EF09425|nr:acyltransferase family protein [Macrococcus brunensis]ULG74942.1 acyltransferase [Macrococcus brunensis]
MDSVQTTPKKFRPEIEGLRAVAALLVAVYHIWLNKVSGGVDVFFVVSGFLITTSLLSRVRRNGKINFFDFIFGLLKRLMPSAFFVLLTVIVLSFFFLDQNRWLQTIREVFASALYFENWQLAISSTDYLDQYNAKSPIQHFWAMSIQGQFYIIWFLIFATALLFFKKQFRRALLIIFSVLFAVSFIYSIYLTSVNQPFAYFDTRTRVWEFAFGAILCLTINNIKLPPVVAAAFGWIGLLMLILCGLLLNVSSAFPGYVALIPTLAAVFILVSGENQSGYGVEKFLGQRFMVKLGGFSYGFYLWHWVILVFYKELFKADTPSLTDGLAIMLFSLLLSWLVTAVIEKPIRKIKFSNQSWQMAGVLLIILLPVLLVNTAWQQYLLQHEKQADILIGSESYPGAQAANKDNIPVKPYLPDDAAVATDKAKPFLDGCQQAIKYQTVKICEYGVTENYEYTVALVGGSHSTHWFSTLEEISKKYPIRIVNMTKSGCRLTTEKFNYALCDEWNEKIIDKIADVQPDIVFAPAEISHFNVKEVPEGYLKQFEKLNALGIHVFGVRDTPYFKIDIPDCLVNYGRDSEKCTVAKNLVVPEETDWSKVEKKPTNVHYYDYTDYICPDDLCRPVIGNVVAYFDKNHMTDSFGRTLAPTVEKDLIPLLEDVKKE